MHVLRTIVLAAVAFALTAGGCGHQQPSPGADKGAGAPVDPNAVSSAVSHTEMVGHGVNKQLTYKASQFGSILVYDADTGQFVYKGYLKAGERLVFEPASSRATIEKQTVDLERVTNERDEYQLYFTPR